MSLFSDYEAEYGFERDFPFGVARVKYCSQKGFLKNKKLSRRSQHGLNRLLTEIRSGRGPIFRIFHEVSGNQSGVGVCFGKESGCGKRLPVRSAPLSSH